MSNFINVKLKVGVTHHSSKMGSQQSQLLHSVVLYVPPFSDFCEISGIFQRILCCSEFLSGLKEDKVTEGNQTYVTYLKFKVKSYTSFSI